MAIKKTYAYHKPSEAGIEKIAKLRQAFSDLEVLIEELALNSRERSIAITQLQLTSMCAIKAVVTCDPESVAEGDVIAA